MVSNIIVKASLLSLSDTFYSSAERYHACKPVQTTSVSLAAADIITPLPLTVTQARTNGQQIEEELPTDVLGSETQR